MRRGDQLGPYAILSPIGAGGMGEVYRARDTRLDRDVAIKVLPTTTAPSVEARERLRREGRAVAALQHPHICGLHDIGESTDGHLYLVMELLQGEALHQRLARGALAVEEVLSTAVALADALDTAHAARIIRRDIKPANIFLTARGPKMLDFGLAQVQADIEESASQVTTPGLGPLTVPGTVIGTLAYMSPEQLRGEPLDARSDLFSLGLVIYEMSTGRAAFGGPTSAAVAASILHDAPQPPRTLRSELPEALDAILAKALEKDRTLRYQHASELLVDLRRVQHRDSTRGVVASKATDGRRRSLRRAVPAVGIVLAVVAALVAYWVPREAPARTLTDKDTIVLADFQNRTGDPVFDEALRQGLAAQLGQSPFLSLVSEERLRRTLKLMGQPDDAPLTPALARDACERLASRVVLEGSIAPLGSQYVLGLRTADCASGEVIDDQQVQAPNKEDVLRALSQMAETFRRRVGESAATVTRHSRPLEQATTRSLEALKAYSAGWRLNFVEGTTAAIPQLKRAVDIDPDFAVAHAQLGLFYTGVGEQTSAREHTQKAYALRDRTSDVERFWITFLYERQVTGNLQKALQTLELWSETYPRDSQPLGLLTGFSSFGTGRHDAAIAAADRAIALDPDMIFAYVGKARALTILDRPVEAAAVLDGGGDHIRDFSEAWAMRFHLAFLVGDQARMQQWLDRGKGRPRDEESLTHLAALAAARAGQLQRAGELSRSTQESARQAGLTERASTFAAGEAVWEGLYGRPDQARRLASRALELSRGRDLQYGAALALALAGDWPVVRSIVGDLAARFPEDTSVQFTYLPTLRGWLALGGGSPAAALAALEPARGYENALAGLPFNGLYGALYSAYVRGQAYLAAGRAAEAAAEFQKIIERRGLILEDPIAGPARLLRARALVRAGNREAARDAYDQLLAMWKDADAAVPLIEATKGEASRLQDERSGTATASRRPGGLR